MSTANYRASSAAVHGPEGLTWPRRRPISQKRTTAILGAALAALALAGPAAGSLQTQLDRVLRAPGIGSSRTGAIVFDRTSSRFVYRHNPGIGLLPASNEKLSVAVTALTRLGGATNIPTVILRDGIVGRGGVLHGRIVLKGYGDPTLSGDKLARLAQDVAAAGIVRVTGAIVGDESYFDTMRVAPGWKANFYKEESPPLSALVVDRARVKGGVATYPAKIAAWRLKRKLKALGVAVPGRARMGSAPGTAVGLGRVWSPDIARLVHVMNRQSDNFYAEMLLKTLGARLGGGGTTAAGLQVVRAELRKRGVSLRNTRLADGSGLSLYDRLTARAVAMLLISAFDDAKIGSTFLQSLPLAGVNGTLSDRMNSGPAYGTVRAKTGTTDAASALSGYVRSRYVFSILMNGSPIPYWYARKAQDRFAQLLAGQ
jgi:D-alanyl-D-alanine carboxypeptidase/D-alanyl-D-alanine-endopeptidase (penicillin-binding protein 4)